MLTIVRAESSVTVECLSSEREEPPWTLDVPATVECRVGGLRASAVRCGCEQRERTVVVNDSHRCPLFVVRTNDDRKAESVSLTAQGALLRWLFGELLYSVKDVKGRKRETVARCSSQRLWSFLDEALNSWERGDDLARLVRREHTETVREYFDIGRSSSKLSVKGDTVEWAADHLRACRVVRGSAAEAAGARVQIGDGGGRENGPSRGPDSLRLNGETWSKILGEYALGALLDDPPRDVFIRSNAERGTRVDSVLLEALARLRADPRVEALIEAGAPPRGRVRVRVMALSQATNVHVNVQTRELINLLATHVSIEVRRVPRADPSYLFGTVISRDRAEPAAKSSPLLFPKSWDRWIFSYRFRNEPKGYVSEYLSVEPGESTTDRWGPLFIEDFDSLWSSKDAVIVWPPPQRRHKSAPPARPQGGR